MGNPAAVCPLEEWLPDETLMAIAAENNLSETAFFVPEAGGGYHLRWFTPTVEVNCCGHATLATGSVILNRIETEVILHTTRPPDILHATSNCLNRTKVEAVFRLHDPCAHHRRPRSPSPR